MNEKSLRAISQWLWTASSVLLVVALSNYLQPEAAEAIGSAADEPVAVSATVTIISAVTGLVTAVAGLITAVVALRATRSATEDTTNGSPTAQRSASNDGG
ncbi:hypothetical protein ACFY71_31670 [Streptomyces cinerochromogenes]|uniref:hypothetical protein n=1 Tax=Streptomyces cinerochromogenes TaxID=66422 RepID=UPI0036A09A4D